MLHSRYIYKVLHSFQFKILIIIIPGTLILALKDECRTCSDEQKNQAGHVAASMMAHDSHAWKMFLTRYGVETRVQRIIGWTHILSIKWVLRLYEELYVVICEVERSVWVLSLRYQKVNKLIYWPIKYQYWHNFNVYYKQQFNKYWILCYKLFINIKKKALMYYIGLLVIRIH